MAYKVINTGDTDLNRVQQNVATAFGELTPGLAIRTVLSSATATTERVAVTDRYIIVNSRGGPIKMVLPSPTVKQEVTVKNATTSANAVTIVQQDGKPTGDGETSIAVTGLAAVTMVADGTAWRRLTTGLSSIIPPATPVTPPIPPLPPTPVPPASISGPFWMSQDTGVPFAVNMGALGDGVLQQTTTPGGVATPTARSLAFGQVLHGGADGLIDQSPTFYWHEPTQRLGVGTNAPFATVHAYGSTADKLAVAAENPDQAGVSVLRLAGYLGLDVPIGPSLTANAAAEIYYTGNTHSGPPLASIPDPVNAMIFNLPNPGFPSAGGHGWLWRTDDIAMMRLPFAADVVELDVVVGRTVYTGGNAGIKLTTNLGTSAKTILTSSANSTDGPDLLITRYAGDYVVETGSVSVTDLVAGGIVFADPATVGLLSTATLKLVTIGSGLSFAGGTLSATGGTGTVTAVTASDGLSFTGTTAVNITHDDSALAPGAHGGSGIAAFTTDVNGHVTAFTGANYQAAGNYITALTGDGTAAGPGSAALTLATVNANVGSFTYGSFTVNAKGLITAASSGATPVPATRTLAATSPILIDGGAGPLDLSANRTFSHTTSGVVAAAYAWANVTVDSFGHVTAISANTAPQPAGNYLTALTGDGTAAGPGSSALTLATVNSDVGTFVYPAAITVNAKGLVTAITSGFPSSLAWATEDNLYGLSGYLPTSSGSLTVNNIEYSPGVKVSIVSLTINLLSNPLTGGTVTIGVYSVTLGAMIASHTYSPGDPAGVITVTGATSSASTNDTYSLAVDMLTATGVSNFAFTAMALLKSP